MLYSVIIGAIAATVSNNAAFNYAGITVQPQENVMQMALSVNETPIKTIHTEEAA